MNLLELKSAYDNESSAVVDQRQTETGRLWWLVEPGDCTRYTVIHGDTWAMAFAGMDVDRNFALWSLAIVTVDDDGNVFQLNNPSVSGYQKEILFYLATLALGVSIPEPMGLTARRRSIA